MKNLCYLLLLTALVACQPDADPTDTTSTPASNVNTTINTSAPANPPGTPAKPGPFKSGATVCQTVPAAVADVFGACDRAWSLTDMDMKPDYMGQCIYLCPVENGQSVKVTVQRSFQAQEEIDGRMLNLTDSEFWETVTFAGTQAPFLNKLQGRLEFYYHDYLVKINHPNKNNPDLDELRAAGRIVMESLDQLS